MSINSNPWYVIDRLGAVMFDHGAESKESKEGKQFLFSTSYKATHIEHLLPTEIYQNNEISVQISLIDHPQIVFFVITCPVWWQRNINATFSFFIFLGLQRFITMWVQKKCSQKCLNFILFFLLNSKTLKSCQPKYYTQ